MKFTGQFWNKQARQNETFEFEATQATMDDVRTRMRNRNPTDAQVVEAFCEEVTRSCGGRTVHSVRPVQ